MDIRQGRVPLRNIVFWQRRVRKMEYVCFPFFSVTERKTGVLGYHRGDGAANGCKMLLNSNVVVLIQSMTALNYPI